MPSRKNKINYIGIVICIFLLFYILFYSFEKYEHVNDCITIRNLETDGFVILHDDIYNDTVDMPCPKLKQDILSMLPDGYVFMDYIYKIHNVALSTFHRDVTSSQHIYNTKHKIYTCILYKYKGDLLSVCPGSNNTYPFVWSNIVNIEGNAGTVFLFDSNLLHAGQDNLCKERNVIQYKVCHVDDLDLLSHLHAVKVTKSEKCELNIYNTLLRKLSYFFEFPINHLFYRFIIKKEDPSTLIGKIQSAVPIKYYNN